MLAGTVQWENEKGFQVVEAGQQIEASATPATFADPKALERRNRELTAELEAVRSRVQELEAKLARRPIEVPIEAPPQTGSSKALSGSLEYFLEQYRSKVPLSAPALQDELRDLFLGAMRAGDSAARSALQNRLLALLRLHENHPAQLAIIAKEFGDSLGGVLVQSDETELEVRRIMERLASLNPNDPEPLLALAEMAAGRKGFFAGEKGSSAAERWYLEVLERKPDEVRAAKGLATLYLARGDSGRAFQFGDQALSLYQERGFERRLGREVWELGCGLGALAMQGSDFSLARKYFEGARKALEVDPDADRSHKVEIAIGLLNLKNNDVSGAIEQLRRAAEPFRYERVKRPRLKLAKELIDRGIFVETKEFLDLVLKRDPENEEAKSLLEKIPD